MSPPPMLGMAAVSHPGVISLGAIWASGLFTGLFWLAMGLTGAVIWIAKSANPLYSSYPYRLGVGGGSPTNQGAVGRRYLSPVLE